MLLCSILLPAQRIVICAVIGGKNAVASRLSILAPKIQALPVAADADTRERQITDRGNVADVHTVYNAVQYADELREHGGNGQGPDEAFNVIRPEVVCEFQGKAPPQCSWQT